MNCFWQSYPNGVENHTVEKRIQWFGKNKTSTTDISALQPFIPTLQVFIVPNI